MTTSTVLLGPAGYYVEWFNEDTERCAYWYGTREDCERRASQRPPRLYPMTNSGAPPYDAATATGMYDRAD